MSYFVYSIQITFVGCRLFVLLLVHSTKNKHKTYIIGIKDNLNKQILSRFSCFFSISTAGFSFFLKHICHMSFQVFFGLPGSQPFSRLCFPYVFHLPLLAHPDNHTNSSELLALYFFPYTTNFQFIAYIIVSQSIHFWYAFYLLSQEISYLQPFHCFYHHPTLISNYYSWSEDAFIDNNFCS